MRISRSLGDKRPVIDSTVTLFWEGFTEFGGEVFGRIDKPAEEDGSVAILDELLDDWG